MTKPKYSIIARKTKRIRHLAVRILAPKLYEHGKYFPRPMTEFLKTHFEARDLVGAEIGVGFGENAENMLRVLSIRKLFLIDPFQPYLQDGELITRWYSKSVFSTENRLSKFKDKIEFVRRESSKASNLIPDNLDFVYVDGNHAYQFVKKDLQLYYPKVRENGVIGGHDFSIGSLGVCKAVIRFVNENNLNLQGRGVDWWIIKPLSTAF